MAVISPDELLAKKIVEVVDEKVQKQQAGIDVTVREVYVPKSSATIDFDNKGRRLPEYEPLEWKDDKVELKPGIYKVVINEVVRIPKDAAGICLPRSTLTRSGCTVYTALWDPGYIGRGELALSVQNPYGLVLKKNARIAQIFFIRLEKEAEEYKGAYKHQNM